jgi:hypothetical protein
MAISVLASIFDGANQSGTARLYGVSKSQRYHRIPGSELSGYNLYRKISSTTEYSSSVAHCSLILFGFSFPLVTFPDYQGEFVQLTNAGSGKELDSNLSSSNFDNVATSALLVAEARGPEFRLSFRDLFLSKWNTMLDSQLAGTQASREGDPVLTWEMFPAGVSYLDPNSMYLKIYQKLHISIDWWPDYDASLTYHIFLYLDSAKHLKGYVARWAYWVEGGVKSGQIADKLKPKVIAGMDTLNAQLNTQLALVGGFTFKDLYYLPGKQTAAAGTGVTKGATWQDVTIVLEH